MNDYTPMALNWFLFVFGTFITLVPFIFKKKFGFFMYFFSFVNTCFYSINFLFYTLNGLVSKTIFEAMLFYVLASAVAYVLYLVFLPTVPMSNRQHFFSSPESLRNWRYLLFPAVLIYTISILLTKTGYGQILSNMVDTQNLTYNNLISGIFFPFVVLIYATIIKIILANKKMDLRESFFLLFIVIVEILRAFLGGSKAGILAILLFFSLIYLYKKGINIKLAIVLVTLLIFSSFFYVSMANIRKSIEQNNVWASMTITEKLQYIYEESTGLDYLQALINLPESLGKRLHGIQGLSLFIERTPSVYEYMGGASYVDTIKVLIPRTLWKEKNVDDFAHRISYNYFDSTYISSASPYLWGEPYLNFGIAGMLFFACLIGVVFKFCEALMKIFSGNFLIQTLITFNVYRFAIYEGNSAKIIPGIISSTIIFLLLYFIIKSIQYKTREQTL